jgi:SanA protein
LDLYVAWSASPRIFQDPAGLQDSPVALVLGTNKFFDGALNPFYTHRIEAAARLFRSGKVSGLLVSGDHSPPAYSEPTLMREDLIRLGVPGDRIASDLAGLRTLDSVVRAKEVFGLSSFVVVSQRFHCERAIFIARAHGIEAYGFPAEGVPFPWSWRARAREFFARLLVWTDLYILGRRPRHLGPFRPLSFPDAQETSCLGKVLVLGGWPKVPPHTRQEE